MEHAEDKTLAEKLQIINQCSTPQDLADQSLNLLGNPLIVFDVNMHVLAITECSVQEDEYVYLRDHHYPSKDFTREPGWQKRVRDILRDEHLHIEKLDSNAHMHKVVRIGGTAVGQMEIIDYFRPFTEEDQLLVEVMARVCAGGIVKQLALRVPNSSQLDYMVEYLLDGNTLPEEEVLNQACLCDWVPGEVLYVLCANAFMHGAEFQPFDEHTLGPEDRVIRYKNCLLLILSGDGEMDEAAWQACRERLSEWTMEFGMSRPFGHLSEIRGYFEQAQSALEIGRRVAAGQTLYPYDDYLEYLPIMEAAKSTDVLRFVMPKLLELAEYDRSKQLCALYTLRDYVHGGRSVSATAQRLHLHRNTVNYRIARSLEFLGLSIEDPKAFEQLAASIRILEYVDFERYFTT